MFGSTGLNVCRESIFLGSISPASVYQLGAQITSYQMISVTGGANLSAGDELALVCVSTDYNYQSSVWGGQLNAVQVQTINNNAPSSAAKSKVKLNLPPQLQ